MHQFKHILYVADPLVARPWALERAWTLARSAQARLTLIGVAQPVPAGGGLTQEQIDRAIRNDYSTRLDAQLAHFDPQHGVESRIVFGRLHIEVIREVLRGDYDLVIKAAEGEGSLRERLFGSRDMHLLRKCPCPVWLLKSGGANPYSRILAAVDVTPDLDTEEDVGAVNRAILLRASALALTEFAELHVAHVWEAPAAGMLRLWDAGVQAQDTAAAEYRYVEEMRTRHAYSLKTLLNDLREIIGDEAFDYLKLSSHLPRGAAAELIPALAAELAVDLIVMGTLGRSGIPGLLIGNTAETILGRCDCDVLAIKPPSFVTPVTLDGS